MNIYGNDRRRPGGSRARHRVLFVFVIILATTLSVAVWRGAQAFMMGGQPEAVRLHVVPNSDSAADQQLKLAVRDALKPVAEQMMAEGALSGDEEIRWLPYVEGLRAAAKSELARQEADYPVAVFTDLGEGGDLAAIRVVIGEGRGANWFCVLVPPLCFADLEPIEKVAPRPDEGPEEGGIRIAWKWLGRWFGESTVPFEGVGDVDQDDVHTDLAHSTPRDGDVGLAAE